METESFGSQITKAFVYFGVCGAVVLLGWNEPLSYRFKSAQEIADLEAPPAPPVRRGNSAMTDWIPGGTSLDRAPYEVKNGRVKYTNNFDPKKMGTGSETGTRTNTKVAPAP